jgi:hypothetical protein
MQAFAPWRTVLSLKICGYHLPQKNNTAKKVNPLQESQKKSYPKHVIMFNNWGISKH